MAATNHDRVGRALEQLAAGPCEGGERGAARGRRGDGAAGGAPPDRPGGAAPAARRGRGLNWDDPQVLLGVMWNQWNAVFGRTLGNAERSLVSELRDIRN